MTGAPWWAWWASRRSRGDSSPYAAGGAQRDRLHLHAVAARRDRDAFLAPQRKLQPLQPIEPRAVCAAAPAGRGSHPVAPLAGEALREQDATAESEGCERQRPLGPGAVHGDRRAPAGAVVLHQRDVQDLVGTEATQPYAQCIGPAQRLLPRPDPVPDHQGRRVVRRATTARVHGQLEVEYRLARDHGQRQTEEPAASRVADAAEGESRGIRAGGEQAQ